jgi:hypothetical protein
VADERLRAQLVEMVRRTAMPSLVRRAFVQKLCESGVDVRVLGSGWSHSRMEPSRVQAPPSTPSARLDAYRSARVVVCPVVDDRAVRICLEAVSSGGCVVLGPCDEALWSRHPQLSAVLSLVPHGETLRAMAQYVRVFLRDEDARRSACAEARAMIAGGHTLRDRWATLHSSLAKTRSIT